MQIDWSWNADNSILEHEKCCICWFWNTSNAVNNSTCLSWNASTAANYNMCRLGRFSGTASNLKGTRNLWTAGPEDHTTRGQKQKIRQKKKNTLLCIESRIDGQRKYFWLRLYKYGAAADGLHRLLNRAWQVSSATTIILNTQPMSNYLLA